MGSRLAVQEARVDKEPFALAGKDAFLKLELVGVGIPVLRRATEARTCTKSGVVLAQNLRLDVLPENTELQIKLVTSKGQGRVTNIAGGGIFVHDIIEAGSCNKVRHLALPPCTPSCVCVHTLVANGRARELSHARERALSPAGS